MDARDRNLQPPVDPPDSYWEGEPDEPFCDVCDDSGWVGVDGETCHDCLQGALKREET
jgi:NAD-dependent dihydropyrimidine dehydrogenase PreA subunit